MPARLSKLASRVFRHAGALLSALFWFFLTRLAGASCVVAGVYVLLGFGWALIAAGIGLIAMSEFIRSGLVARG